MDWGISLARAVPNAELPTWLVDELEKGEFFGVESECLDFKRSLYADSTDSLAEAARDIAAFHNTFGGFLVFGVDEVEKDVRFSVCGETTQCLNFQQLRGKLGAWLDADIAFTIRELQLRSGLKVCVLWVPKRSPRVAPNKFKKRGPQVAPNRYAFDAGDVPIRRSGVTTLARSLEDWQMVLSERSLDELAASIGQIFAKRHSGAALDHNLPSRSIICSRFVGRQKVLTAVWAWLNDPFQYAKVIAGEGGKGKTSVAYEFATQVAHCAPLGIERIVWLTAKRRQFAGIENTWRKLPETHFSCFRTMLEAIGQRLGYTEDEMHSASDAEIRGLVRAEIGIQPSLFVLDDIDSLTVDDQRRALEFAQQCGGAGVRFLLTTRSNASYSSETAITLEGLQGAEYEELVAMLCERYSLDMGASVASQLYKATSGSPLLTDSVLRIVRRGSTLGRAIEEWKGKSGEDARDAVLGREIDQLSSDGKRALLCLAFLGQCSKTELMNVSGVLAHRLADVLEELQSLFIVSAPKIIESEPRFEIGATAALLVLAKRTELAGDHVALERRVKELRTGTKSRTGGAQNRRVAQVISQALALLKAREPDDALRTVEAGLKSERNHPDLLLLKARLLVLEMDPPDYAQARDLLRQAYDRGVRKHILFDLLYKAERELRSGPGVIDVAGSALLEFPAEETVWRFRRAEGFLLNAISRSGIKDFDQSLSELMAASRELRTAQRRASGSEQSRLKGFLNGVHDKILEQVQSASLEVRLNEISLIRELVEAGDHRSVILSSLSTAVCQRMAEQIRRGGTPATREHIEANRRYAIDILQTFPQEWATRLCAQLESAEWERLLREPAALA